MSVVRISIVGGGTAVPFPQYRDGANTKEVTEDLRNSFGRGYLEQNGFGIISETLTGGDYQYTRTGTDPQGRQAPPPTGTQIFSQDLPNRRIAKFFSNTTTGSHNTCFLFRTMPAMRYGLWVLTRHGGNVAGKDAFIHLTAQNQQYPAKIVYDDETIDLALAVSAVHLPRHDPRGLVLDCSLLFTSKLAFVAGFGTAATTSDKATVITCNVAHESAGYVHVDLFPPEVVSGAMAELSAEEIHWEADKFFLLDKALDVGFSGSPAVTAEGKLMGMQCATNKPVGMSWALKNKFIHEAVETFMRTANTNPHYIEFCTKKSPSRYKGVTATPAVSSNCNTATSNVMLRQEANKQEETAEETPTPLPDAISNDAELLSDLVQADETAGVEDGTDSRPDWALACEEDDWW